jgi:hypothetical protein
MAADTVAQLAVEIALEEANSGVFENANDNRGSRIDEYQRLANSTVGQKWCAKFVYWCFDQAAKRLGGPNPFPRIFGAGDLEAWASRVKKSVLTPALGDVFVKEHRHVGLVAGDAVKGGTFRSVEGNTWARTTFQNRREGVYVLSNTKVARCTFVRPV